jgi:small redox-active disulfide protein 2
MRIEILGPGCPRCEALAASAQAAVTRRGVEAEIVKVKDIREIAARGVMVTPALVIDGHVKSSGKLLSPEEIEAMLP